MIRLPEPLFKGGEFGHAGGVKPATLLQVIIGMTGLREGLEGFGGRYPPTWKIRKPEDPEENSGVEFWGKNGKKEAAS